MDDGYVAALHLQATRCFEPEQTSSDHHRPLAWRRAIEQRARVVQIAKDKQAFFFQSIHRRNQRSASRCDQQFVERRFAVVIAGHHLALGIHVRDSNAKTQHNPMFRIPLEAIQLDFIRCFLASQHRGQQDAVVIEVGFIPEDGDFKFWRMVQDLFDASDTRHSISYHHEPLHHRGASCAMAGHFITTPALPPCGLV